MTANTTLITESDRLILRTVHISDLDAAAAMFSDPEVMRYSFDGVRSRIWVSKWIQKSRAHYESTSWGFGPWAVTLKGDNRFVGYCGFSRFDDVDGKPETEIAYRLVRPYWGKGIGTEAASVVLDHGIRVIGLDRVIALIHTPNKSSLNLASKLGMRFEKHIHFHGHALEVHYIDRAQWSSLCLR